MPRKLTEAERVDVGAFARRLSERMTSEGISVAEMASRLAPAADAPVLVPGRKPVRAAKAKGQPGLVGAYRSGKTPPGLVALKVLAEETRTSLDYLVFGAPYPPERLEPILNQVANSLSPAIDPFQVLREVLNAALVVHAPAEQRLKPLQFLQAFPSVADLRAAVLTWTRDTVVATLRAQRRESWALLRLAVESALYGGDEDEDARRTETLLRIDAQLGAIDELPEESLFRSAPLGGVPFEIASGTWVAVPAVHTAAVLLSGIGVLSVVPRDLEADGTFEAPSFESLNYRIFVARDTRPFERRSAARARELSDTWLSSASSRASRGDSGAVTDSA